MYFNYKPKKEKFVKYFIIIAKIWQNIANIAPS